MRQSITYLLAIWLVIITFIANHHVSADLSSKQHNPKKLVLRRTKVEASQSHKRQQAVNPYSLLPAPSPSTFAEQITSLGPTDPVQAAKDVASLSYINETGQTPTQWQLVQGDTDEAQLPQNIGVPFSPTPNTTADAAGGWQMVPQLEGFILNRTWAIRPGAVMPFYITAGYDPAQVKRAVITFPGKPRDAWKYANLYRNALNVVYANESTFGVATGSVIVVSPVWLNELDQEAGGSKPGELYFHGSEWEAGGASRGPNLTHSVTTYEVMDNFTDMLFDKTQFPALNQVVVGGHSMGGQAAHRYALLKKQKAYDNNMSFWVGNPGSWSYLSPNRPFQNATCSTTYDAWHYGLGQNQTKITKYARADVVADKQAVVNRYINRQIHMALGLLDNGAGDTHCEASDQGKNHLDRGSRFVLHVTDVNNGTFPPSQTVDFVGNTSHQDFGMISANLSLYWLFANNYNVRNPDIIPHNPGDKPKHSPNPIPKPKAYATHGNEALASGLLGGSLVLMILIFSLAPFAFRSNFDDHEFQSSVNQAQYSGLKTPLSGKEPFATQFNPPTRYDTFGSNTTTGMPLIDVAEQKQYYPSKLR